MPETSLVVKTYELKWLETTSSEADVLDLLYYLFSAHHWPLSELQRLWEGETKWWDLVNALSSFECEMRANPPDRPGVKHLDKKKVKLTRAR